MVVLDSFDADLSHRHEWGPCAFTPHGDLTPERGARCLVAFDEGGEPYLVWWEGQTAASWAAGDLRASAIGVAAGWALCDGAAAPSGSDLYAALVAAGYPFGRVGSDPAVPDLMGRAPIGAGTGRAGLTARRLGVPVGAETHRLTSAESGLPAHTHQGDFEQVGATGSAQAVPRAAGTSTAFQVTRASAALDASSAHNNMQPSLPVYWLVKL